MRATTMVLALSLVFKASAHAQATEPTRVVPPDNDAYATLLTRSDPVWSDLVISTKADWHRPVIGNGRTGGQFSREGNTIAVQLDRQDAYGPRAQFERILAWNRATPERRSQLLTSWHTRSGASGDPGPRIPGAAHYRCPFGNLVITPVGTISADPSRIHLWDGIFTSELTTDRGSLRLTAFTAEDPDVVVMRIVAKGEEAGATAAYQPYIYLEGLDDVLAHSTTEGDVHITVHPYNAENAGARTVAWTAARINDQEQLVIAALDSGRLGPSRAAALEKLGRARAIGFDGLLSGWQTYLRNEYRRHFLSFTDTQLESMYWIGIYRLIGQFHPDGTIADNAGMWLPRVISNWTNHLTNNMNAQCHWAPLFPANLSHRARPFIEAVNRNVRWFQHSQDPRMIGVWSKRTELNYADNGHAGRKEQPEPVHIDDVPMDFLSCPEIDPIDGLGDSIANMSWRLHNYYWHYRVTMDEQMARRLFVLLKMNLRGHWHQMRGGKAEDGTYHMYDTVSPEFKHGGKGQMDAPYSTAAARWVVQTLIELNDRWSLGDPERDRWIDIDQNLAPYPHAEGTFRDFADAPPHGGHRHFSHLVMAWPYHVLDTSDPTNRALLEASIEEMMSGNGMNPWSFAGLVPMAASIGSAQQAYRALHAGKCYAWGLARNPLLETSILQTMAVTRPLLLSYGGVIRVFPAVPEQWPQAVFHDLRAGGAFDVSAKRTGGTTRWIQIASEAGEPCRLQTDLPRPIEAVGARTFSIADDAGILTIDLEKGERVLLKTAGTTIDTTITPVPGDGWVNWWPEQRKNPGA